MSTRRTSTRNRTLLAAVLGLGMSGIAAGVANVGNPTTSATASPTDTTTVSIEATTTTSTPEGAPTAVTEGGPQEHVTALVLPDPVLHPGAIDPTETKAKLCASGFRTSSVRPSTS